MCWTFKKDIFTAYVQRISVAYRFVFSYRISLVAIVLVSRRRIVSRPSILEAKGIRIKGKRPGLIHRQDDQKNRCRLTVYGETANPTNLRSAFTAVVFPRNGIEIIVFVETSLAIRLETCILWIRWSSLRMRMKKWKISTVCTRSRFWSAIIVDVRRRLCV